MAIATSTAIALGGLAISGTSAGMSFAQASKQKKAMLNAEAEADKAMQAAREKLNVNFYDVLSIQKEPYELEREALLASGAQAIQAGVESERGAAATAGRIQMAQQQGQGAIRTAMGQELSALEKLSVAEEARLRDAQVNLDLGEVEGAQLAAANAQMLQQQALNQGMQSAAATAQQALSFVPLDFADPTNINTTFQNPFDNISMPPSFNSQGLNGFNPSNVLSNRYQMPTSGYNFNYDLNPFGIYNIKKPSGR
jgi:hypothetical protein